MEFCQSEKVGTLYIIYWKFTNWLKYLNSRSGKSYLT